MGSGSPPLRGTLSLQLVASATWDLCRLIWSPPLRGTFVASVGRLRYVGPLSLQLVASATWDLCHFSWSPPLCGILIASATRDLLPLLHCLCCGILISSAIRPCSLPLRRFLYLAMWDPRICYVTSATSIFSKQV